MPDFSTATAVPVPLRIANALELFAATGGGSGGGSGSIYMAAKSIDGVYRFKDDGSFQLYNADTSMYHTLSLSGADGAVTIDIAAGEA